MKSLLKALLILLIALPAHADVAFDAFAGQASTTQNDSNFDLVGGAGLDGVLVTCLQAVSTPETVTVTHGGIAVPAISGFPDSSVTFGEVSGMTTHAFFQNTGLSGGTQSVAIDKSSSNPMACAAWSVTVTTTAPEVNATDNDIDSAAVADPTGSIALGGATSFVIQALTSGHDAVASVTPPAGWTSSGEVDAGPVIIAWYTFDTIGSSDVTYGWTQTSEDAYAVAIAINEPTAGGQSPVPIIMQQH